MIGPPDIDPPDRPVPGPLKWDLTRGIATDTPESLFNSVRDPSTEATHGRAFAEDLPTRALKPSEAQVLSQAIKPEPGRTLCSTWDVAVHRVELDEGTFAGLLSLRLPTDDELAAVSVPKSAKLRKSRVRKDKVAQI